MIQYSSDEAEVILMGFGRGSRELKMHVIVQTEKKLPYSILLYETSIWLYPVL